MSAIIHGTYLFLIVFLAFLSIGMFAVAEDKNATNKQKALNIRIAVALWLPIFILFFALFE